MGCTRDVAVRVHPAGQDELAGSVDDLGGADEALAGALSGSWPTVLGGP